KPFSETMEKLLSQQKAVAINLDLDPETLGDRYESFKADFFLGMERPLIPAGVLPTAPESLKRGHAEALAGGLLLGTLQVAKVLALPANGIMPRKSCSCIGSDLESEMTRRLM